MSIPDEARALLEAPNYVHLSTIRANGAPRNHVVWVGLDGEHVLVCTSESTWKAVDMHRNPNVALFVIDIENPYDMAALQGEVVDVWPDEDCRHMDPISIKYTGSPFPYRGSDRVCFVIAIRRAARRRLPAFTHNPPPRQTT
jgi:PPOX class probable F420-dependent enzyme